MNCNIVFTIEVNIPTMVKSEDTNKQFIENVVGFFKCY